MTPSTEYLFDAHFRFLPKKLQLFDLMIWGPSISDRVDRLAKQVDAHPEWSDSQVVATLRAAGAKFGPDDRAAFLSALPLKALEPLTGRIEIVSAKFGVRFDSVAEDEPRKADLTWEVEARSHSRDGHYHAKYFLKFEPFEGVLIHLDLRGPR